MEKNKYKFIKIKRLKNKFSLVFCFAFGIFFLLSSANKTYAAFSCDSGSLADGATCTVTSNKTLGAGENITGANATLVLSNNAQIIGALGSAATIMVQNLTVNTGSYINFDGKGKTGGAGGAIGATGTAGNTSGAGGGAGGAATKAGGGGGYGGVGGVGSTATAGGAENDQANIHQPIALGSGGGGGGGGSYYYAGSGGGAGGGAVKLNISGTLTLNSGGYITANGANGTAGTYGVPFLADASGGGGAGSGGSIWIQAGTITGAGTIRANGGVGGSATNTPTGGGGSGGRVAITYATDSSSNYVKTTYGGNGNQYGASGSIYTKQDIATYGDLTFNNNSQNSPLRTISSTYGVQNFSNLNFSEGTAGFTIASGATLNIYGQITALSANAFTTPFINNGTFTQNSNTYTTLTFSNTFTNAGTITMPNLTTLTFSNTNNNTGTITANSLTTLNVNGTSTNSGTFSATNLDDLNIGSSMTVNPNRYSFPIDLNVTINNGGILTHSNNTTARTYYLDLTIANLTINSGGYINIDGKGKTGGAGGGINTAGSSGNTSGAGGGAGGVSAVTAGGGGGGGYGGVGGVGYTVTTGGIENDQANIHQPIALGSGGGGGAGDSYYYTGGAGGTGGGAVKLNISGTLTLNSGGYITANGSAGSNGTGACPYLCGYSGGGGAGSGGSIWIQAGTITGTGTIRANGGTGGSGGNGNAGGGGSGGRIALFNMSTQTLPSITPTVTGGTGYTSGAVGSIYKAFKGIQTSQILDFQSAKDFLTLVYNKTAPTNTLVMVNVRGGNIAIPNDDWDSVDSTWTAWQNNLANNASLNAIDNKRYAQYQLELVSTNLTAKPLVQDITLNYNAFVNKTITSSPYVTGDSANTIGLLTWDETVNAETNIKFQMRTSGNGTDWSAWLGPDGTINTYFDNSHPDCAKVGNIVTCDINEATPLGDHVNDQYFQYKAYLESLTGDYTPNLNSVTVTYVVNAYPEIQNVTASQGTDGIISISYETRDPDTTAGSNTPNFVTPSFQYWDGDSWENCTTISSGATDNKGVEEANWNSYILTWNPKIDFDEHYQNNTAKIRVKVNDNEPANNITYEESNFFTLDTKNPIITDVDLDASTNPSNLDIFSTDDSTYQMKVSLLPDLSDKSWTTFSATPTITLSEDPETVYVMLKDQYNNVSTVYSTISPATPQSLMVQDNTNVKTDPYEFRLFTAWKKVTEPLFDRYELYRSEDGTNFILLFATEDINTNSYPDDSVEEDVVYCYKIKTIDTINNQSYYSDTISAKANGIQDYTEGGGGISTEAPDITNVNSLDTYTTQATITWDTDQLSNSNVGYSKAPGAFTTEIGTGTLTNNEGGIGQHRVTLINLEPNTTYYFQVKSSNIEGITATENNGGDGFTFTTDPGPVISNVTQSRVTNTTATINWLTDIPASSVVTYSTNSDLSDSIEFHGSETLTEEHEVRVTDLTPGTRYYYYVKSTDDQNGTAIDNNGGDYYFFATTQDLVAPIITFDHDNDILDVSESKATITWLTNEQATSKIEYGPTTAYGEEMTNNNLNTNQIFRLANLTKGTTYHFKISSTDENDNISEDDNNGDSYTFTTLDLTDYTPPVITFNPVSDITNILDTSARISWITDESASAKVEYGTDPDNLNLEKENVHFNTDHIIELTNLSFNTTYYLKITSADPNSNSTTDDNDGELFSFTTTDSADRTSPIITFDPNTGVTNIANTSARIIWTTNEAATAKVTYGTAINNLDQTAENIKYNTNQIINLENLISNTTYFFKIESHDINNNNAEDTNEGIYYSFSTTSTPDTTPPEFSNITTIATSSDSATITWNTDESASSFIQYSSDKDNFEATYVEKGRDEISAIHSVTLDSLAQETTYYFRVRSVDAADNEALDDNDGNYYSFYTNPGPAISNVAISSITSSGGVITWTTSENSDAYVIYDTNNGFYNPKEKGSPLKDTTAHSITLDGLDDNTVYYFKVRSANELNGVTTEDNNGDNYTFETDLYEGGGSGDGTGPVISNVSVTNLTYNSATVEWETDEEGNSLVDYGIEENNFPDTQGSSVAATTVHEVNLKGLNSITTYYYQVKSQDISNNTSTQSEDDSNNILTFTTLSGSVDSDNDGEGDELTNITEQIRQMLDSYSFTEQEIR
ncbi:MAG: fibronectin type III domain-containing protein, partial [Candidatus Moraniibacteriota bacterium]